MSNIKALFKVLTQNTEMKLPKTGKRSGMYRMLGTIAVCCIMIPCCVIVGFVSYIMTLALTEAGAPTSGIMAEIHIMSAFSLVFGMLVIFNILFFSSDREHLLPLPFKGYEILLAKFFYAYIAESIMEFLILISMFTGFFLAYGFSLAGLLSALVGVLLIPLMPLAYCTIIGLVLLCCLKGIKNANIFSHASTIVLFIFVALFLFSFRGMGGITVDNYVNSLASGDNLFSEVLSRIFFATPSLLRALEGSGSLLISILNLLLYILLNGLLVLVMAVIGKYTYSESLMTVGALGSRRKVKEISEKYIKSNSVFKAYFIKEVRVLIRTKAYSGNCVFINLLWPVLAVILYEANKDSALIISFREAFLSGNDRAYVLLALFMAGLTFIASAMNSLASTAFTREGLHIDMIKYIPVPYKTQALCKACISLCLTMPGLILLELLALGIFKISYLWFIYHIILMLGIVVITTVLGMYLDSAHPHLTWDDEYSALRGNLNTFFNMAVVMLVAGIICSVGFLLFYFGIFSQLAFYIYLAGIILVLAAVSVIFGFGKITNNMEEMLNIS